MKEQVRLLFSITINDVELSELDNLGEDLAVFLEESFFNGEDVVGVKFIGQELLINK